jgi:hypothetical protein
MLDDFTLNVSYLAAFLIILPLLVSQYLRLTGNPVVRHFSSYLRCI